MKTCREYCSLKIIDLYSIDKKILLKLNDKILKNYQYVIELDANNNNNITDVNHMIHLKKLNASQCGITDRGISMNNLEILHASNNEQITKIRHMTKLRELYILNISGITKDELLHVKKLKILDMSYNYKFNLHSSELLKDMSHLKTLFIINNSYEQINIGGTIIDKQYGEWLDLWYGISK